MKWLRCVLLLWALATFTSAARAGGWNVIVERTGNHYTAGGSRTGTFSLAQTTTTSFYGTSSQNSTGSSISTWNSSWGSNTSRATIWSDVDCTVKVKMVWRRDRGEPLSVMPPPFVTIKVEAYVESIANFAGYEAANAVRLFSVPENGFSDDPRTVVINPQTGKTERHRLNFNYPSQYHLLTGVVQNEQIEFSCPLRGRAELSFDGYSLSRYGNVGITAGVNLTLDSRQPKIEVYPNYSAPVRNEPGNKEINAYATIGLFNDGIPENPIVRFFEGNTNFTFDGLRNGSTISLRNHKWSVSPSTFLPQGFELLPSNSQLRAESEVAPPTRIKNFHWNLGAVEGADPASFPKSTFVNVSAIDPSDGVMLHGTAEVNWHLTPSMRFRLEGSIEPILPPDHDPGDEPGAAEWEQIEMIKETRRQLADSGIQVISIVFEGGMLVVDVMMPDVTDVALGVVKAARAVRLVGKMQDVLNTIKQSRLAAWRAKRAARGKSPIVALESLSKAINKGRVGTKLLGAVYNEADEAVDTVATSRRVIGGSPKCFVAGTLILTSEGFKPIEQITDKDRVLARDEITGKTAVKRVLQTFKRQVEKTLVVSLTNGDVIETTDEHPFYVEGVGFMPASSLKSGSRITTYDGVAVAEDVEHRNKAATVYNFEVEDFNTYFVGNSKVWVHNWCGLPSGGTPLYAKIFIEKPSWWPGWQPGQTFTDLDDVRKIGNEYWVISDKTAKAEHMVSPADMANWIKKHIYDPAGDSDLDRYYNAIQHGTNVPDDLRQAFTQGKLNFGLSFQKGASITPEFEAAVKEALGNWEEQVIKKEVGKQISIGLKFPWEI